MVAEAGCDVGVAGEAEGSDGEVAQDGHGPGCVTGVDAGGVFGPGRVADVVDLVLNARVVANALCDLGTRHLMNTWKSCLPSSHRISKLRSHSDDP